MSDFAPSRPSERAATVSALSARATRVFEFLIELQRLRTKVVRNLDSYRSVLWYGDLPDVPEIVVPDPSREIEAWLSVERVERDSPPTPPAVLAPWITTTALRNSRSDQPVVGSRAVRAVEIVNADGEHEVATEEMLLADHPEVHEAFGRWLPTWKVWAELDRTQAAVAETYQQLYGIYQDSHALAETYETLLCFGYLTMRSGGQDVGRHLIAARVAVELDLDSGRLTVLPAPGDSTMSLEQDMLDPADTVPDDVRQVVLDTLTGLDDPWENEPSGVVGVLRTWVNGRSADAAYLPSWSSHSTTVDTTLPTVTFAPALILRERTRRSFIAACEQIIAQLRVGTEVPTGVRQFVDITDGVVSADEQRRWADKYADVETYFPKASNEDQRQIVQRLAESQTVVVHGPPGTGKTHTIANLVTDLLGHGQRVLITSNTTRALNVLKGQLPTEISDLCVSVTDDAVKGQADLEHSVTTILSQADAWNSTVADAEATTLRSRLAAARTNIAEALGELRSIQEQETYEYAPDIGDYFGTLQTIATRLNSEQERMSWIGAVPTEQPAITVEDAQRFLELLRRAPELTMRAGAVPAADQVPSPVGFDILQRRRTELDRQRRQSGDGPSDPRFRALSSTSATDRHTLRAALSDFIRR